MPISAVFLFVVFAASASPAVSPSTAPSAAPSARTLADTAHCVAAAQFLRDQQRMIASVDRDTIDDWRTGRRLAGCRVTAAGATSIGVAAEAVRFYERLRAARWTRTPEPRDAPNEASLRFRWQQSDCVFNVYEEARLGTDAELRVNDALRPGPGETRYQALALCMPALPASP